MKNKVKDFRNKSDKPISPSLERDYIEKRYPNLQIVDTTEEMIGKTSLFTWIQPLPESNKSGDVAFLSVSSKRMFYNVNIMISQCF